MYWVATRYSGLQQVIPCCNTSGAHCAALQEMVACALVGKPLADALLFEAEASNWSACLGWRLLRR